MGLEVKIFLSALEQLIQDDMRGKGTRIGKKIPYAEKEI